MDLNKLFEMKKFFMRIYKPIIEDGNNLKDNEKIIVSYKHKDNNNKKTSFSAEGYNNIDDLITAIINDNRTHYLDCYFNLSTSDKDRRQAEDMKTRTCIGIDFDNEQLTVDDIQRKFKEIGLFYNAIVHSGHGLHVYILIEPTKDLKLVQEVTKKIIELTGADNNANTSTQLLRVPFTKNFKNKEDIKKVRLWHLEEESTVKRKNINVLAKRLLNNNITYDNKTIKFNSNCRRVEELIKNGSNEHEKHNDLLFLYRKLKQQNVSEGQLQLALDKWNDKSNYSEFEDQLKYLEKENYFISCKDCKYKNECWSYEENREQLETDLILSNSILKKSSKKGAKKNMLKGNELLVYGIIYIQQNITVDGLVKEFTVKDRKTKEVTQCLSINTIRSCLKTMEEKGIVLASKDGNKNVYSLKKPRRLLEDQKVLLSSAALYERIKGNINEAEFQLYCFMKYLQWEQRNLNKINSNFKLKITQKEIAGLYGISVTECNRHIQKLIDGKYISIAEGDTHKSSRNGYDYYTYTLNY